MINATEVSLNISTLHTYRHPLTHSSLVLVTTLTLTHPMSEAVFVTIRSNLSVRRKDNDKSEC